LAVGIRGVETVRGGGGWGDLDGGTASSTDLRVDDDVVGIGDLPA